MTPTPASALDGKPQPGWFGLTMQAAAGSSAPGRWWSVISVAMPSALRARDALDAGDAVVDGDEQVGLALRGEVDELGRQAVAELEAVGHEVVDVGAERAQRAHADRAGGCAVGVVVGDDQQALARRDRVGKQRRRVADALQQRRREQAGGVVVRAPWPSGCGAPA